MIAGRYRLIETLGAGGMGQVWKARDETLNIDVAIKEIRVDGEEAKRRALAEARNAAALRDHPNIVAVHDAVEYEGVPWTVMRLVNGRNLAEELAERGSLHPDEVAKIAAGVLSALGAAHAAGIIHRDVKPANVMLASNGTVLLADFGIAKNHADTKLTATGVVVGSLEYVAPERFNGKPDTTAVDLFSLGATLYEAVEGTSPFRRATPTATMAAIAFEPLPALTRAGRLEPLITALLEKDPETRADVNAALGLLAGQAPAPTRVLPNAAHQEKVELFRKRLAELKQRQAAPAASSSTVQEKLKPPVLRGVSTDRMPLGRRLLWFTVMVLAGFLVPGIFMLVIAFPTHEQLTTPMNGLVVFLLTVLPATPTFFAVNGATGTYLIRSEKPLATAVGVMAGLLGAVVSVLLTLAEVHAVGYTIQ